jgi:sirohydrochlorin cobaltochelatase
MKQQSSLPAVLLIGHGTRLRTGVSEFNTLAKNLQIALPDRVCMASFLELVDPTLQHSLDILYKTGFRSITALPAFLMAANHIKKEIPALIQGFQDKHPDLKVIIGKELGINSNLIKIAKERIENAESKLIGNYNRKDALLLLIGRGSSDTDANSNISKISRMLWEEMGFGWAETAYTAITKPLIDDALGYIQLLGFKYLVIFPYLLFDGKIFELVCTTIAAHQAQYSKERTVIVPYLNNHPLLTHIFLERLAQAEACGACINCNCRSRMCCNPGRNHINC